MPTKPPRACPHPGCPNTTPCAVHRRRATDRARARTSARGYGWRYQAKRERILNASGRICWICNRLGADTVDHVIPLSQGGDDSDENLRAAHACCNYERNKPRRNRGQVP